MTFVTLFPKATNIHLVKDVGQIPFTLKERFGIDGILVTGNKIKANDEYMQMVPGLKIVKLPFRWLNWKIGCVFYLFFKAKTIDWLNLYHFGKRSFYLAKLYKFRKNDGHVYLKMDMNFKSCDRLEHDKKSRDTFIKCLDIMDVVSVESEEVKRRIQRYTDKEVLIIPNGCIEDKEKGFVRRKKENIFLTVGRLGTKPKATEVLLEAFAISATRQNWILELAGTVSENFREYIEDYFLKYPELKERVIFLGDIRDRKLLNEEYEKAKVFILPSRWEGFPLVLSEAQTRGCKMILTSSIPPCKEFVPEETFGAIVEPDNSRALAEAMVMLANADVNDDEVHEIASYAREKFSWEKICAKLLDCLINTR